MKTEQERYHLPSDTPPPGSERKQKSLHSRNAGAGECTQPAREQDRNAETSRGNAAQSPENEQAEEQNAVAEVHGNHSQQARSRNGAGALQALRSENTPEHRKRYGSEQEQQTGSGA
jgi:hypothetical protein